MVLPLNVFPPHPEMLTSGWQPCIGKNSLPSAKPWSSSLRDYLTTLALIQSNNGEPNWAPNHATKKTVGPLNPLSPTPVSYITFLVAQMETCGCGFHRPYRCIKGRHTESDGGAADFQHALCGSDIINRSQRPQFQERMRVLPSSAEAGATSLKIPAVTLRYRQSSQTHGGILQMGATLIPCDSRSSEQKDSRGFLDNGCARLLVHPGVSGSLEKKVKVWKNAGFLLSSPSFHIRGEQTTLQHGRL